MDFQKDRHRLVLINVKVVYHKIFCIENSRLAIFKDTHKTVIRSVHLTLEMTCD